MHLDVGNLPELITYMYIDIFINIFGFGNGKSRSCSLYI